MKIYGINSYDTVGEVAMQSNKKIVVTSSNDMLIYKVSFINGNVNMKDLLMELITYRINKKYD